jgi:OmpA-OmpF porin, OOP family
MTSEPRKPVKQKCRACGFDGNPSDARRCMVCDEKLNQKGSALDSLRSPLGILGTIGVGALLVFGYYSFSSLREGSQDRLAASGTSADQVIASVSNGSEAPQVEVTSSANSWSGYFLLRQGLAPKSVFGKILAREGLSLKNVVNEPDQAKLAKIVSDGTVDIAMTTVDPLLLNPFNANVVAMVDVSTGGDAIALRKGLKSLDDIKPGMKVAYARATPSETLLRTLALRFEAVDLERLKAVEVTVADEAWALLKDGKVDVAVIWQPFVGLARNAGLSVPITSADAKNTILDVMVASNKADPEKVKKFVSAYCEAADYYISRPDELKRAVGLDSKVSGQDLVDLAQGIYFVPCKEADRLWFNGGLFEQRKVVISEIVEAKRGQQILDPKPLLAHTQKKENRLRTLAGLDPSLVPNSVVPAPNKAPQAAEQFAPLSGKEASTRQVLGSLRVGKVNFASASPKLTSEGIKALERFQPALKDFPGLRVVVEGHTSSSGNPQNNQMLSQARASAVVNFFVSKGYPRSRFNAIGYGASKPLPNTPPRSYANRRTEIKLIR